MSTLSVLPFLLSHSLIGGAAASTPASDTTPQTYDMRDLEFNKPIKASFPTPLKRWLADQEYSMLECAVSVSFDAWGRLDIVEVDACPDEVAPLIEKALLRDNRRWRVTLPEGSEQGLTLEFPMTWRV